MRVRAESMAQGAGDQTDRDDGVLRVRVSQPGVIGALGRVASASVQSAASRWRARNCVPSLAMRQRIAEAVPKAEAWLFRQREEAVRRAALRKGRVSIVQRWLCGLMHGGCKAARDPGVWTVARVAAAAGMSRELAQGVRDGNYVPAEGVLSRLEGVMRAAAGTTRPSDKETWRQGTR